MGCASSQEAKAAGASGAKGASEPPPLEETVSKKELLMNANARMSHASFGNAQKLFQQYRHRQSTLGGSERLTSPGVRGSNTELSRTARMDKRDLRRLLHDVDPELFEFVWGLFDPDKTNAVCADEFVAAMALLSKSASSDASLDDQIKACFAMFDTRDDGRLSHDEFRTMIEATVTLNLKRMLLTETGLEHVGRHMEKEFSKENLTFWQEARAFHTLAADERLAAATKLIEHYVRNGAEEEVNLPDKIKKSTLGAYEACKIVAEAPPPALFAEAEEEIFKLMERDAYARFKANPESVSAVVESFFKTADLSADGFISFAEYKRWVMGQPQVIVFFTQLAKSISALLKTEGNKWDHLNASPESSFKDVALELPPTAPATSTSAAPAPGEPPLVTPEGSETRTSLSAAAGGPSPAR